MMNATNPQPKPRITITTPALSGSVVRLMGLAPSDEGYFDAVLALVSGDPGLSTRLLGIANSALLSSRESQAEVRAALTRVGPRRFASIVIGGAIDELFEKSGPEIEALLAHSRSTALLSRLLAGDHATFGIDPYVAHTLGLLHNIGALVLAFNFPVEYVGVLLRNNIDSRAILHAEREAFGVDHLSVGLQVADQWSLPEVFRSVIADHHASPTERKSLEADAVALTRISLRMRRVQACNRTDEVERAVALRALIHEAAQTGFTLDEERVEHLLKRASEENEPNEEAEAGRLRAAG